MLIEEAKWFGKKISEIDPSKVFPMANIGSSTLDFRKKEQPWIDEYIFEPIRKKKKIVKHIDIKGEVGVDIVGNLADPKFLKKISKMKFKSVLCSNLLEHVQNRETLCKNLVSMIQNKGYLFISCPFEYPHHPDPIDTMFRPDIDELSDQFPKTMLNDGKIITCRSCLDYYSYTQLTKMIIRLFVPFYKPKKWLGNMEKIAWILKKYKSTCVLLQKISE